MEWTRGPVLGRGSSATVSAATSTSGDVFAVKSMEFSQSESLQKEQHFLSILKSPYVVSYKGCDITIEENKMVYNIFIEYMSGGSIIDSINRRNGEGLTNLEIASYTRHIVKGLEYIHSNGLVHCDIKGGNILLQEGGIAKISDFGCAKRADQASPVCGTPMFMAPEVARGEEQEFPADVWALGCTVIEMATGVSPWPNANNPVSVLYRIAYSGETPKIPDGLSDQAKDFVSKCLIRDPRRRWTAKELLEHPFIRQFDENSNQIVCEQIRTDSPTSILDQDVWNSISSSPSLSPVGADFAQQNSLSNSVRQRVEQLVCKSEMPNWGCEKRKDEWVMVRGGDRWR
ncbi:putative mitogen-activated protein kinase kinase kinase STE-STE11 family [Helianthus annuus]|uniref:Mitogen-activated protein kinase kinase kinase STE-STE11 family n=1 Tax=Helianthus annuus TaxID=4232 RepID=A0A251V4J9_HELAN|nr:mitogen-activated protein kinase kinase kinase 17 [Helianthus annuus]KAF5812246.1 putative mitogen-activated protein kinase kinase kinase STE-STE11 family [Helianthus annuus]KAJ0582828.1 putative mitogen-activated protein kinase kinase kinase STE-STE11 family [Helianthus annuus]KAJ0591174.1 putative mitogen-activated protein kinase kinase kinase STE-STE11 family [Helianthus annuus]KAJ0598808.1 putative mitogen-activated protein kinase kinase kinase STE-STE11 family [Helianthus annuus]KAJ093